MHRLTSNKRNGKPFIREALLKRYPHYPTRKIGKKVINDQRKWIIRNRSSCTSIVDRAMEVYHILSENSWKGKTWNNVDMCLIAYLHHHMTTIDEMVTEIEEVEVDADVQAELDDEQRRFQEITESIQTFWENNPYVKVKYDSLQMFKNRDLYNNVVDKFYEQIL